MNSRLADDLRSAPAFTASRLLVISTGAASAVNLPFWLRWLSNAYPALEFRTVLTRSALRFLTVDAVALFGRCDVTMDEWQSGPDALHVELARWPEVIVVHPATLSFVGRFAQGLADTPAMLALQCTASLIGLAPALPPGGVDGHAYRMHRTALDARPNVVVADPEPGLSASTGSDDAAVAASLSSLLRLLEQRRQVVTNRNGAQPAGAR